tara:strand:- start:4456 stop:5040 length:585 start_codon:yes stop_codon:yes gene_type:complete
MIKKLSYQVGSRTKALELMYLLRNIKKVVRQGYYADELHRVQQFCKQEDLHLVKSKFKVLLGGDQFYSNKGLRVQEDHKDGMHFVYISKDEKSALMTSFFELVNNHVELGKLLGYPECCIRFFVNTFSKKNPNPEIQSNNPFTNISLRQEDMVLINHFPCSENCEQSVEIGKNNLEAIGKYDKKLAEEYFTKLS